MQLSEAKQYLCHKLNISYADILAGTQPLFTDAELTTAVDLGAKRAWNYRRWPFTVDALKITYATPASGEYYVDYPNTFEDDSIFTLMVNDAEWGKRNFLDYKKWFSDYPTDVATIWASFKRQWFANKNALADGDEIALFGKLRAPTISASTDLLPFSPDYDNNEDSGNEAVCRFALGSLLASEKKREYAQGLAEEGRATAILDALWAPMKERDSREQSQNRPFFDVPDFFAGNRRPGNTNIGNFP